MPGILQDSMGMMDVLPAGLMAIMSLVSMKVIMDTDTALAESPRQASRLFL